MTTAVLISGPPRSGKSTLASLLMEIYAEETVAAVQGSMGNIIKVATHAALQAISGRREVLAPDHFEETKDEKSPAFHGLKPRQAYVTMHEGFLKALWGPDFVAKVLAQQLASGPHRVVVVPDLGMEEQMAPFAQRFRKVIVISIRREGASWTDNRRSVAGSRLFSTTGMLHYEVENNGSIADLKAWLRKEIFHKTV